MKIKVMEYNVFSGRNFLKCNELDIWNEPFVIDISLAAKVIAKHNPDIVGLCEVHSEGDIFTNQTEEIAKICDFPYSFFSPAITTKGNSLYGVAFLSKYPILKAETHLIPDPEEYVEGLSETRCVAKVTIDAEGKKIDVLVSHFGLVDSERKNAVKLVKSLINKAENPCVLMGDFNCTPDSVHIKNLEQIIKNTSEGEVIFTYSSVEPDRQIDYIFASEAFKVNSHGALDETASDHKPYFANLELKKEN